MELARLEERITAIREEMHRAEEDLERRMTESAAELARHLEKLNHAHEQAVERNADYISREAYSLNHNELLRRMDIYRDEMAELNEELSALRGRLWLPMLVAGGLAAALALAIARYVFKM